MGSIKILLPYEQIKNSIIAQKLAFIMKLFIFSNKSKTSTFPKLFDLHKLLFYSLFDKKFQISSENFEYMVLTTQFDIINYTKNSESSMKIASLTTMNVNQKIRENRSRIQQNLKLKLNQHQKKEVITDNTISEAVLPLKTQTHIKILSQVGMVQKQYIQGHFEDSYDLKQKIGEGAHASVYRCIQKNTGKEFAVKITKQGDEELIACSKMQFKILKNLNHENVMKAEAFYTDIVKLTTYLVCELCSFPELAVYMRNRNKNNLDETQATAIIASILETLQYLHKKGVCHRDIKPENILYNEETKKIKVIDFDCAKNKKQSDREFEMWTKTGSILYQAPEYFQNAIYNEKVDLWATGVIAYELVAGESPFKSLYYNRIVKMITEEKIEIDSLKISDDFKLLLKKLLERDPSKRSSAGDCLRLQLIMKARHVYSKKILDDFEIKLSRAPCTSPLPVIEPKIRSIQTQTFRLKMKKSLLKYFCFVEQF